MSAISKSSYSDMDKEILYEEYIRFRAEVKSYSKETPYYVYSLCEPNGEPFYVGKGKNMRAFDHLKSYVNGTMYNKNVQEKIESLGTEPPIMFLIKGNLTQPDALKLEESIIEKHGRFFEGGQLSNILSGGSYNNQEMSSIGGKIGGRTTKDNNLGIFSPTYDRGAQNTKNFENGLMDHIDFVAIGKIAGAKCVEMQVGIHDPKYADQRSEWGSNAAKIGYELHGNTGFCSKEYREANKEKHLQDCSNGGKIGGKILGTKLWWNNGIINTKSNDCPGDGWVHGQLMSEKKRLSVIENRKKMNQKNKENPAGAIPQWTNGIINKRSHTQIGPEWFRGQTNKDGTVRVFKNKEMENNNV